MFLYSTFYIDLALSSQGSDLCDKVIIDHEDLHMPQDLTTIYFFCGMWLMEHQRHELSDKTHFATFLALVT